MTVGETIKEIRHAYGITQKQLAAATGIDDATIRKYEAGKLYPKYKTLEKIAKGLGVEVEVLTEGDLNTPKAMQKLFSVFKAYSGELKLGSEIKQEVTDGCLDEGTVFISFGSLQALMYSWYMRFKEYKHILEKAEAIESEEYRQMYIEEAEKQFNLWMFRYPESDNDKSLLKVLEIMDEASNFMGTHPLNDPEHPVTEKQKEEYSNELRRIYAKLNDVRLF
ncbi:MAG: helix-turn-helix domain-containing protein [Lachnospiraceae bacterium]|nr:helix-turn-helix domain-containing protein [Lachnospiraceae bacterium]